MRCQRRLFEHLQPVFDGDALDAQLRASVLEYLGEVVTLRADSVLSRSQGKSPHL